MLPEECFLSEYYTEIYLRFDSLKNVSSYSSEYEELAETLSEEVENRLAGRTFIRHASARPTGDVPDVQ